VARWLDCPKGRLNYIGGQGFSLEPPEIEFSPPISAFPSFSRSTPCLSTIWQFIVLGKEGEKLGGGSRPPGKMLALLPKVNVHRKSNRPKPPRYIISEIQNCLAAKPKWCHGQSLTPVISESNNIKARI